MQKKVKNELTTALVTLAPDLLQVAGALVTVADKVKDLADAFHVGLAEIKGWWAIIGDILKSGLTEFSNHIADMLNAVNKSVTIQGPDNAQLQDWQRGRRRLPGRAGSRQAVRTGGLGTLCVRGPQGGGAGSAQGADRRRRSGLPGEAEGGAGAEDELLKPSIRRPQASATTALKGTDRRATGAGPSISATEVAAPKNRR